MNVSPESSECSILCISMVTSIHRLHTHYRKEMISVLDRLATEFRDVQRSAESVAQPFACLQWRREGGGGAGGLVPRGPGQLWGPGPSWIFFFFFLIGSQWEIQDFDKGGGAHLNKILASLRSAGFLL